MKQKLAQDGFEGPARIRGEHVVLNPEAPERYRRYSVRDDHPLTRAYEKGQLEAGRRDHTARDRWEAGLIYRGLYEEIHASGMAATKFIRVNGAAFEQRASERVCNARQSLAQIDARLSGDNAFLLRRVCGEGFRPAEVINARLAGFEKSVWPYFCSALDDLVDAVVRLKLHRLSGVAAAR